MANEIEESVDPNHLTTFEANSDIDVHFSGHAQFGHDKQLCIGSVGQKVRCIDLKKVKRKELLKSGVSQEGLDNKSYEKSNWQKHEHRITKGQMQVCVKMLTEDEALTIALWCASFFDVENMLMGLCLDWVSLGETKQSEGHKNKTELYQMIGREIEGQRRRVQENIPNAMWRRIVAKGCETKASFTK
jgi:hypothetical protein